MRAVTGQASWTKPRLVDVAKFDHLISINLRGVMLCYKYAAIQMVKQGRGGRIIGTPHLCITKPIVELSNNFRPL